MRALIPLPLAMLLLVSCRSNPVAPLPTTPDPGPEPPVLVENAQVPVVDSLRSELRDGALVLHARVSPRDPRREVFYSPERAGGWTLQLFVNADQAGSGWWRGYDFVVRGAEPSAGGGLVVRLATPGEGPGGWGDASGEAKLAMDGRSLELTVPLAALGDDDGLLDWALETYATVACTDCEGGLGHSAADDYFGSTGGTGTIARAEAPPGTGMARARR